MYFEHWFPSLYNKDKSTTSHLSSRQSRNTLCSIWNIRVQTLVIACKFCDAGSELQRHEQNMQIYISSLAWSMGRNFLVNSADQCLRLAHILRGCNKMPFLFGHVKYQPLWMKILDRPNSEHWEKSHSQGTNLASRLSILGARSRYM